MTLYIVFFFWEAVLILVKMSPAIWPMHEFLLFIPPTGICIVRFLLFFFHKPRSLWHFKKET